MVHSSARQRILDEGLRLACTRGLCGVTFGEVAKRANVSKSGVVAHFANTKWLKAAVIVRASDVCAHACLVPTEGPPGLSELERYLRRWMHWTQRAGLPGGCPIASAMFEYNYEARSVRGAVVAAVARWRVALVDRIEGAIAESGLARSVDPSQLAWNLLGVYLSHHVSWHCLRESDADRRAQEAIDLLIAISKPSP